MLEEKTVEFVDEQTLTAYAMLQLAEQFWEALDNTQAERLFTISLNKQPTLQDTYISYSQFLKQQNRHSEIVPLIQQCIPLNKPFNLYKKFFILAEQQEHQASLSTYKHGLDAGLVLLELPDSLLDQYNQTRSQSHKLLKDEIRKDLSVACAAVAQICMTHLLHIPATKQACQMALEKGRQLYDGVDIGCQMARYLLLVGKQHQATAEALRISDLAIKEGEDCSDDLKMQLARVLGQVQQFERAKILVESTEEGERDEEGLYLLAYYNFKTDNIMEARDWLAQLDSFANNMGLDNVDGGIMQARDELQLAVKAATPCEETGEDEEWVDEMDCQEDHEQ